LQGRDKGDKKVHFTPEMVVAFKAIKEILLENTILHIADSTRPFIIHCDASSWAIGCILSQLDKEGLERPVAFYSRKLTGDLKKRTGQRGWSPREQETYAIVASLAKFEPWLIGNKVVVKTDHKSLESWHHERMDTMAGPAGRRGRWHEFFSRFDLEVHYLPGDKQLADPISRWAYPACEDAGDQTFDGSRADQAKVKEMEKRDLEDEQRLLESSSRSCYKPFTPPLTSDRIARIALKKLHKHMKMECRTQDHLDMKEDLIEQSYALRGVKGYTGVDPISEIIRSVTLADRCRIAPSTSSDSNQISDHVLHRDWTEAYAADEQMHEYPEFVAQRRKSLFERNGRYIREGKTCVPRSLIPEVCKLVHSWSHVSKEKTEIMFHRRYFVEDEADVAKALQLIDKSCSTCQAAKSKPGRQPGKRHYHPIPADIFSSIAIDFVALPEIKTKSTHYDQCMVIVDRLSGYVQAIPCLSKGMTADKAAELFYFKIGTFMGLPKEIMSDKDKLINAAFFKTFCALSGIETATSTVYRPASNGRAECAVKAVVSMLRKCLVQRHQSWHNALPLAVWAINEAPGVLSPYSPHNIVFGRDMIGFGEEPNLDIPKHSETGEIWFKKLCFERQLIAEKMSGIHRMETERFNNKHPIPQQYQFGDKVWVKTRPECLGNKLTHPWVGPCEILTNPKWDTYTVSHPDGEIEVNQERLKMYIPPFFGKSEPLFYHCPELRVPENEVWNVEKVLKHKIVKGKLKWLVRWEGYDSSHDSWEPAGHFLPGYNKVWTEYNEKNKVKVDLSTHISTVQGSSPTWDKVASLITWFKSPIPDATNSPLKGQFEDC
jgi:hypothetical protein